MQNKELKQWFEIEKSVLELFKMVGRGARRAYVQIDNFEFFILKDKSYVDYYIFGVRNCDNCLLSTSQVSKAFLKETAINENEYKNQISLYTHVHMMNIKNNEKASRNQKVNGKT